MERLQTEYTAGRIVKWGPEKLGRMADPSGLGREVPIFFEEEIIWVRGASTSSGFFHGGEEITSHQGLSDFSGFLLSLTSHARDAAEICANYSIDETSTLEYLVSVRVTDTPFLRDTSAAALANNAKGPGWKKQFFRFPERARWFFDTDAARGLEAGIKIHDIWDDLEWLAPITVEACDNIWSSKKSADENAEAVRNFIERHRAMAEKLEQEHPFK